ncbi:MAG: hypothetical protein EOL86_12255 [Deltaproteobacteria bacterium]|nr:hypothetical protein [Deltaproteobacteria bacterium]
MIRAIIPILLLSLATPALADDYVGRALTTCAPLDGTSQHSTCLSTAANDICGVRGISPERVACLQDFERYFTAKVAAIQAERQALKDETDRKIRQLQDRLQ